MFYSITPLRLEYLFAPSFSPYSFIRLFGDIYKCDLFLCFPNTELNNPFQLDVFETMLYWSTMNHNSPEYSTVMKMNKLGKGIPVLTLGNLVHPTGVKLYHKLRYDIGGRCTGEA